jgi:hypothetical protein
MGHYSRSCPEARVRRFQSDEGATTRSGVDGVVMGASSGDRKSRKTYIQLRINGVQRKVLLDTGSDATLLPSFAVRGVRMEVSDARLVAANGTSIRVKGKATVEAFAGPHRFEITGLVTDHVAELMLGFDLLKELGAVWNFQNDEIQLAGVVHKLCSKERTGWCRRVILQSDCVVPSRSEVVLPTKVVYNDLTETRVGEEPKWITEAQQLRSGLQVCRTVLPEGDIDIPVRVMNVLSHPIT